MVQKVVFNRNLNLFIEKFYLTFSQKVNWKWFKKSTGNYSKSFNFIEKVAKNLKRKKKIELKAL